MSRPIGLIVGSAFAAGRLAIQDSVEQHTPYGSPSSPLMRVEMAGHELLCIARHGLEHQLAPHQVNYRANVYALHSEGVGQCIGLNVVGGISPELAPGEIAVPDQLIDFTWGRESTFGRGRGAAAHVEFSDPFDAELRDGLTAAIRECGYSIHGGTYAVTQGPRLETVAEIDRLRRCGCTMVGMTAMPEAVLARELGMQYALCAASVNYAAGCSPTGVSIHEQLDRSMQLAMDRLRQVIERYVSSASARSD